MQQTTTWWIPSRATIITQLVQRLSSFLKHFLLSISCVYLLLTKTNQYAICGSGILQMVSNHLRLIFKRHIMFLAQISNLQGIFSTNRVTPYCEILHSLISAISYLQFYHNTNKSAVYQLASKCFITFKPLLRLSVVDITSIIKIELFATVPLNIDFNCIMHHWITHGQCNWKRNCTSYWSLSTVLSTPKE